MSPSVLIPRPETETLVELALARLPKNEDVRVLDLGTGSGAIALAIAHERPRASVLATDVSSDALDVAARQRATASGSPTSNSRARTGTTPFRNRGAAARSTSSSSNPPYVAAADPHLAEGDVRFEPERSLTPGGDGLGAIMRIVAGARERLAPGGSLAVEHGFDQADAVRAMFAAAGFGEIVAVRDLAGIPRVVAGIVGV